MRLVNKKGKERIREMVMLRKDIQEGGDQRFFIHFSKPNDVRNMTFMVWKYTGKSDDRWLYIPSIKMVRRIAAKDAQSSFVGSDFTYEDVSGREVEADTHELLQEEALNGRACYVVKSIPKDGKSAGYKEKTSWIDKENFLPMKEEYTDKRGKPHRVFTIEEVKEINGIPTGTKRVMKNIQNGHWTEVSSDAVEYDVGVPDNIFTERSLRSIPKKWIR
jgi:outer membrane lipoprotein-sorting protein